MTRPYTHPQALAFLRQHGVREGSLVTLTLAHDVCWRGHIVAPLQERAGAWLYLSTEDGHEFGIAIEEILKIEEHGYQAPTAPVTTPDWTLPEQETPAQGSLFAPRKPALPPPDTVHIIECGRTVADYTPPPPPSSHWQEALSQTWDHLGPLVYQTLSQTPAESPRHIWQPLVQRLLETIVRRPQGIVVLQPNASIMATAPRVSLLLGPLPCPLIFLGGPPPQADPGAAQDALQAAIYAARYIDTGEVLIACPAPPESPETPSSAPWHTPPSAHGERAPWGSYQLLRATTTRRTRDSSPGFMSIGMPPIGSIHRRRCQLHSFRAQALVRFDPGVCYPLDFAKNIALFTVHDLTTHPTPAGVVFATPQPRELPRDILAQLHDWQDAGLPVYFAITPATARPRSPSASQRDAAQTYHGIPCIGVMLPEIARLKLAWAMQRANTPEALAAQLQLR